MIKLKTPVQSELKKKHTNRLKELNKSTFVGQTTPFVAHAGKNKRKGKQKRRKTKNSKSTFHGAAVKM